MSRARRGGLIASQCSQDIPLYENLDVSESDENAFEQNLKKIVADCQANHSQVGSMGNVISDEEVKKMTRTVVRYLLFRNTDGTGGLVHKKDLLEQLKQCVATPGSRALTSVVICLAREELAAVFGLELKEIRKVGSKGEDTAESLYFLRSLLPSSLQKPMVDKKDRELRCVALVIVSALYLNGDGIAKEDFLNLLEELGFKVGEPHALFGLWEKTMLDVLLKRRYIRLGKGNGGSEEYFIGEIGSDEFSEDEIKSVIQVSKGF